MMVISNVFFSSVCACVHVFEIGDRQHHAIDITDACRSIILDTQGFQSRCSSNSEPKNLVFSLLMRLPRTSKSLNRYSINCFGLDPVGAPVMGPLHITRLPSITMLTGDYISRERERERVCVCVCEVEIFNLDTNQLSHCTRHTS
jgi:hypothetical protein